MDDKPLNQAELLMLDFAIRTGIDTDQHPEKRYLWTDAFAVFNFLSLHRITGDESHLHRAVRLVDLVHHTLGRHRQDDEREGWLSGLGDREGEEHPTAAGLRIGKPMTERPPDDPYDMHLEWDRDGQYFHYLTKWMHALECMARVTEEHRYHRWALELARAAGDAFIRPTGRAEKMVFWKMSIDLSRPLVTSMGQLDALDGCTIFTQLLADQDNEGDGNGDEEASDEPLRHSVARAAKDMKAMCRDASWFSDDELGIGGLLCCAAEQIHLIAQGAVVHDWLLDRMLGDALGSLDRYERFNPLGRSADSRLGFRELGLAIGLRSARPLAERVREGGSRFHDPATIRLRLRGINTHRELGDRVLRFWTDETNQASSTWEAHHDINEVMLVTALIDGGELLDTPVKVRGGERE